MPNLNRRHKRALVSLWENAIKSMAAMNIIQWVEEIDDAADFNVTFIEKINSKKMKLTGTIILRFNKWPFVKS